MLQKKLQHLKLALKQVQCRMLGCRRMGKDDNTALALQVSWIGALRGIVSCVMWKQKCVFRVLCVLLATERCVIRLQARHSRHGQSLERLVQGSTLDHQEKNANNGVMIATDSKTSLFYLPRFNQDLSPTFYNCLTSTKTF